MHHSSAFSRTSVGCSSAGYTCTSLPVPPYGAVAKGICRRKARALASQRLCAVSSRNGLAKTSCSNASDRNGPVMATVSALAAAALLVAPAGGSYAAELVPVGLTAESQPATSYSHEASSLQLQAVPAPPLTAALIPATPFQAPGNPTQPAVVDPNAPAASTQDSSSNCSPPASMQQQPDSPTVGPLDPPTPPNSPMIPPPPHAPLPTPQQPHFPLLPTPPPPALPPQLLPPCNEPPPTKLLPRAPSEGLQQGDVKPVDWSLGAGCVANSSSREYNDLGMLAVDPAAAADSPLSLLQLYKSEQQLQEQWQDLLLYTAMAEGSTSGLAAQEPSALPLPGDVPLPYYDRDLTQSEWQTASIGAGDMLYASLGGDNISSMLVVPAYSTGEPGLQSAASFVDLAAAAGDAGSSAGDKIQATPGSSAAQQLLSGPKLADDFPIQQVLEAVPAKARCPEAAAAAPADCGRADSTNTSSRNTSQRTFAASAVVGTATDSNSTSPGSTGIPVTPMQGGGGGGAGPVGGSTTATKTPQTESSESAKAAKNIQQGIKSAREQIAARSKQLEYESPGYEQLLDASKRLLVALIAIAQFLIKFALSLGVFLVKGLVQLIEWFLNR